MPETPSSIPRDAVLAALRNENGVVVRGYTIKYVTNGDIHADHLEAYDAHGATVATYNHHGERTSSW